LFEKFPIECDFSVFSLFIYDLLKALTDKAVLFLCRTMRKNTDSSTNAIPCSTDDVNYHLTSQGLHYIVGASLQKQIRMAKRYPKNARLQRMKECILSKLAAVGSPPIVDNTDAKFWTFLMNRKALIFANDTAFPFFLHLGKILINCEVVDGVPHQKVMDAVCANATMLNIWDSSIGNSLQEEESFALLTKVVRAVTNTYGRGVMLRRMNARNASVKANKATLAITHRASVT